MGLGALYGIGSGLGQAMDNFQRQRQAQAQQQMMQLLMQDQRAKSRAGGIFGDVLAAGGIPGMGDQGGGQGGGAAQMMAGLGGMPGASPLPQAPGPPPVPMAPSGAVAADPMTGGRPTGIVPLEDSPQSAELARGVGAAANAPVLDFDVEAEPAGVSSPRSGQEPAPAAVSGGLPAAGAASGDSREMPYWLSMFKRADPQALAKRIKEVRPDATGEEVGIAVERLFKLSSGDWHQQATAASVMKALAGDQTRRDLFGQAEAGRSQRAAAAQEGAASRQQTGIAAAGERQERSIAASGARQQKGIDERRYQQALAASRGADKLALSEMHRQLADIRGRISTIDNGPNPNSSANKATREKLQKQLDDIAEREAKRAEFVLGQGAQPAAAAPQPAQ